MTTPMKLSLLTTVLALSALPSFAIAQDLEQEPAAKAQRWYKVELLVFSNESSAASSAEQWEATPTLSYPLKGRFLVDEALYASRAAQYKAQDRVDATGHQLLTKSVTPDPDAGNGVTSPPVLPPPFVTLPEAQREFAAKADRMSRSGRYSVLFHETWVQPMQAESTALPITLDRSGDTLEWPRLQGSIKMHLSRYLHVNTNLWLNTQGSYLPSSWKMPAPPLSPASLLGDELPGFEEKKLVLAEARGALRPVQPAGASTLATPSDAPPGDAIPGLPTGLPASSETVLSGAGVTGAETELALAPQYPFRHAVLLRQSRKMRSNEVHYIDHPMLGVIIKFTPMDEEDLKLLAAPGAGP